MSNDQLISDISFDVLKHIQSYIRVNRTNVSTEELAKFMYNCYLFRTKNHIALVNDVAFMMFPAFKELGYTEEDFNQFCNQVEKHDHDKLVNTPEYLATQVVGSLTKYSDASEFFDPTELAKAKYTLGVIPEHIKNNLHHPESWAHTPRNYTGIPVICSSYALGILEDSDPKRTEVEGFSILAETVADWSAVGIELKSTTAKEWFNMHHGKRWNFDDKLTSWMNLLCDVAEQQTKHIQFALPYDFRDLDWPDLVKPRSIEENKVEPEVESYRTIFVSESDGSEPLFGSNEKFLPHDKEMELVEDLPKYVYMDNHEDDVKLGRTILGRSTWDAEDQYYTSCFQVYRSVQSVIKARAKYVYSDPKNRFICEIPADRLKGHLYKKGSKLFIVPQTDLTISLKDIKITEVPITNQKGSKEDLHTNVESKIVNNKVYHSSTKKLDVLSGKYSKTDKASGSVFVSPFKHISCMFALDFQGIVDTIEKQIGKKHIRIDNFGFIEYNETPKSTTSIPSVVHVIVRTPEEFKSFTGTAKGYIYTIDFSKYKDKAKMWSKQSESDCEFVIEGEVEYEKCEAITFKYEVLKEQKEHRDPRLQSTEALSTKEYTESDINSVEDLKQFYKHCSYGLIDFKANKPWKETHKNTMFEDWEKEWRLLSVEQLLKYRCGICYDTAKMNDYFLTKWKIDHVNLFAYTKRSAGDDYNDDPTHTFTVYKDSDGKWKWLEGSWGPFKNNDWSESSSDALIKNIGKALANSAGVTNLIGVITSWPRDGVSMNEFYHALKDQAIKKYKYEIKPDASYSKESLNNETKKITFPPSEIDTLKTQDRIITTRVSDDYNKFKKGDIVEVPWGDVFKVADRKEISKIEDHPFYSELTGQQIAYLKKFDKIAVLTLVKQKDSSTEALSSMNDIRVNLLREARRFYDPKGSHGFDHIMTVIEQAKNMVSAFHEGRDLSDQEYAACLFHDCALKQHGRDDHEENSAKIAAPILKKWFTPEDVQTICAAIREHRASYTGEFTSKLSDLLSSADRNAPDLNNPIVRSFEYGKELGMSDADAIDRAINHLREKYGTKGYSRYPQYYTLYYKNDILKFQKEIDSLTVQKFKHYLILNNISSENMEQEFVYESYE